MTRRKGASGRYSLPTQQTWGERTRDRPLACDEKGRLRVGRQDCRDLETAWINEVEYNDTALMYPGLATLVPSLLPFPRRGKCEEYLRYSRGLAQWTVGPTSAGQRPPARRASPPPQRPQRPTALSLPHFAAIPSFDEAFSPRFLYCLHLILPPLLSFSTTSYPLFGLNFLCVGGRPHWS